MDEANKADLVVQQAEKFATEAHAGQFLKNVSREPFIMHPRRVVDLVSKSGGSFEEIAAAWLHDVVEDTKVTLDEIREQFGDVIADIVDGLTDPPDFAQHRNKIRKAMQAERVASKSPSIKRVKIADQTTNSYMVGFDPPVTYTPDDRLEYVEGARLIALQCAGISDMLDGLFKKTYRDVVKVIQADRKG